MPQNCSLKRSPHGSTTNAQGSRKKPFVLQKKERRSQPAKSKDGRTSPAAYYCMFHRSASIAAREDFRMKCVLCSTRLTWLNKGRIQKRKEKNTSRFPGELVCAQVKSLMRSSRKIQRASRAKREPSRSKAAGYRRRRVLPALVSHKQCFVERDRP